MAEAVPPQGLNLIAGAPASTPEFGTQTPVPIRTLSPDALMMEPAKDSYRRDATDLLPPPELWGIFTQREMGLRIL